MQSYTTMPKQLVVIKGSRALEFKTGDVLEVRSIDRLVRGMYRVCLAVLHHREYVRDYRVLYGRLVRHEVFDLNNGDPTKFIRVQRRA
jgi:hypothetical protein